MIIDNNIQEKYKFRYEEMHRPPDPDEPIRPSGPACKDTLVTLVNIFIMIMIFLLLSQTPQQNIKSKKYSTDMLFV